MDINNISRFSTHTTAKWLTQTRSSDLIGHAPHAPDIVHSPKTPPFPRNPHITRLPGHLALYPTLYTIAVLILTDWFLAGVFPLWTSISFVGLCAHGCYLLDRVKVADARLDPADQLAQPQQYRFMTRHAKALRLIIVIDLILATAAAMLVDPLLAWIPLVALVCVHLYAGRKPDADSPRLKDFPGFKALFIAGGHTALATTTTLAETGFREYPFEASHLFTLLAIGSIVFADAVLCDLDDHDSDKQFSTKSIPVLLGSTPAWWIAIAAHAVAIALLVSTHGWSLSIGLLSAGLLGTNILFHALPRQRDAVDARLLPLAIIAVFM